MSQENVEIVGRLLDAWNRRDLDAMLDLGGSGSELVFVNSPTAVEPGTRRGRDEVTEVARKQWEILADARSEVDKFFDRGDEVIALGRLSRSMPGSDTRIEEPTLIAYRFRDGKITQVEVLGFGRTEVRNALEAAGLSE
jgi:ketosteroid isomerase-like protein